MSLTKLVKAVLIGTVTVGLLAPMSGAVLSASSWRSATGTVTDRSGAILEGAVVQLKDLLTLNIRSYIIQSDGLYRFHGLHPDIDYELTAAYQGRSSRSRTLSRFNSDSNVRIDLQIPNGDTHVLGGRTSGDTILSIEAGGLRKFREKQSMTAAADIAAQWEPSGSAFGGPVNALVSIQRGIADSVWLAQDSRPEAALICSGCAEVEWALLRPTLCRKCGDNKSWRPTDSREQLVRSAVQAGCPVHMLWNPGAFGAFGGIACLVRTAADVEKGRRTA